MDSLGVCLWRCRPGLETPQRWASSCRVFSFGRRIPAVFFRRIGCRVGTRRTVDSVMLINSTFGSGGHGSDNKERHKGRGGDNTISKAAVMMMWPPPHRKIAFRVIPGRSVDRHFLIFESNQVLDFQHVLWFNERRPRSLLTCYFTRGYLHDLKSRWVAL